MIDPVSIGLAFTAIQQVVGGIKSAIGTGKDINGIVTDIGKFLNLSADIYKANGQVKMQLLNKSSAELESIAFQTAMMANQVTEHRKKIKELLIWSGHGDIWENMVQEHTRLLKKRRELEAKHRAAERKRKQELAEVLFGGIIAVLLLAIAGFVGMAVFHGYTR
jgi:hypothetical protein